MIIRCPVCGGTAGVRATTYKSVQGVCRDCGMQFNGETSDNDDWNKEHNLT